MYDAILDAKQPVKECFVRTSVYLYVHLLVDWSSCSSISYMYIYYLFRIFLPMAYHIPSIKL